MKCYIVTGASRGLGAAFVKALLERQESQHIICLSRRVNDSLVELSEGTSTRVTWIEGDLNALGTLDKIMDDMMEAIHNMEALTELYIIHNAGVVGPIAPIEGCSSTDIERSFNVNTIAPIIMTGRIIDYWQDAPIRKRVMNISSGAADSPYDGWSCYCSTKAALNMFTRCVALEQEGRPYPIQIMGFAPGIVDTDMQGDIRKSDKKAFSNVERFREFKEKNQLRQPKDVAKKALAILEAEDFPTGENIHI